MRAAGGAPLAALKDPYAGAPLVLASLPLRSVEPTTFQRDLSRTHAERLGKAIEATGSDDGPTVVKQMKATPVEDFFARHGKIREDGRMVIANLHTLDTARRYCDRVIGMRDGRIVFDGRPEQLTTGAARDIYGADASFSESATSTALDALPPDTAYAAAMASA